MFDLPGPQRFFNDVVDDLVDGKHVIIVLPEPLHQHIYEVLSGLTKRKNLEGIQNIDVGPEIDFDVYRALEKGIADDQAMLPTVRDILEFQGAESSVCLLRGGFSGNEKRAQSFCRLISRIGKETHLLDLKSNVQFVVLATPGDILPHTDLYLTTHSWWGVISETDIDVATEQQLKNSPPKLWTDYYWVRSLCRGLAQGDPELAQRLVEEIPKSLEGIVEILKDNNTFSKDATTRLKMKTAFYPELLSSQPNNDLIPFWKKGCLCFVNGLGQQLHSSYVATTEDGEKEIQRRVWNGQQSVFWPIVERVRISIVEQLVEYLGQNWTKKILEVANVDSQALMTEIGVLSHALIQYRKKHPEQLPYKYEQLALAWKGIRNNLAHVELLDYRQTKDSLKFFNDFIKSL